jgi:hypothetical protein
MSNPKSDMKSSKLNICLEILEFLLQIWRFYIPYSLGYQQRYSAKEYLLLGTRTLAQLRQWMGEKAESIVSHL